MLYGALDALIQHDVDLARSVAATDDLIDALYQEVYHKLVNSEQGSVFPSNHAHRLLWAAHNLERFGDRVTNICEWVVYIVTGQRVEMNIGSDIPLIDWH